VELLSNKCFNRHHAAWGGHVVVDVRLSEDNGGLFGALQLDWIFVKNNEAQTAASLTPTFGRTMTLVNKAVVPRIAPHSPTEVEVRFDFGKFSAGR
jgi:hypothetical protein